MKVILFLSSYFLVDVHYSPVFMKVEYLMFKWEENSEHDGFRGPMTQFESGRQSSRRTEYPGMFQWCVRRYEAKLEGKS